MSGFWVEHFVFASYLLHLKITLKGRLSEGETLEMLNLEDTSMNLSIHL